jgi:predicted Zn finger-like uncharacterized protein
MALSATCPNCRADLNVPDEFAGKKVRCSRCKQVFVAGASSGEILDALPALDEALPVVDEALPAGPIQTRPGRRSGPEQERGREERRVRGARRQEDEDERDQDDGDGRRQGRGTALPVGVILGGVAALLVPLLIGVLLPLLWLPLPTPKTADALAQAPAVNIPPPDDKGGVDVRPPDRPPDRPPIIPPPDRPPDRPPVVVRPPAPPDRPPVARPVDRGLVGGVSFTPVKLPAEKLVASLCWDADHKSYFALEGDAGVVRRVSFPGGAEEEKAELGQKCSWLSVSKNGVLVTLPDKQEVWVLDPKTLKVRTKALVPAVERGVSAPALELGLATTRPGGLALFNTRNGKMLHQFRPVELSLYGTQYPAVTADGKYLFTLGGEQLHRFRIGPGAALFHDESSPKIVRGAAERIDVSLDGAYVCVPSGEGNVRRVPGHPDPGPYGTYVYAVTDLKKPAFTLAQGTFPRAVGFDGKSGLVYAQDHNHPLMVFTTTGTKLKQFRIAGSDTARQFLVHPEGRRLALLTGRGLYHAEVKKGTPAGTPGVPGPAGEPRVMNTPLAGPARKVDDLQVRALRIPGRALLSCLCWSADGKAFFCADRRGLVRRVELDGWKEGVRLEVGRAVSWLAVSSEGLVVTVPDAREVWLLDAVSLKVKRKVAVTAVPDRTVASPRTALAVASGRTGTGLVDLKEGKEVRALPDELRQAAMTPDGKYVFAQGGLGELERYRVEATGLTREESSERIAPEGRGVVVSPDGKYVCLPSRGGNSGPPANATFVYEVGDLKRPALSVEHGAPPAAVGFDPRGGRVFANGAGMHLLAFDLRGVKQKEYRLSVSRLEQRQLLAHPDGGHLLVLGTFLYHVELPAR